MILVIKYVAKLIKECHYSHVGKYNCCGIKSIMAAKLNELGRLIVHEVYDNFKEEMLRLTVRETAETFLPVHEIKHQSFQTKKHE